MPFSTAVEAHRPREGPQSSVKYLVSVSLFVLTAFFPRWTQVSRHRNVSVLDFIAAEDDGNGQW